MDSVGNGWSGTLPRNHPKSEAVYGNPMFQLIGGGPGGGNGLRWKRMVRHPASKSSEIRSSLWKSDVSIDWRGSRGREWTPLETDGPAPCLEIIRNPKQSME